MTVHTLIRPSIGALGRSLMVAGAAAGATNATYHAVHGYAGNPVGKWARKGVVAFETTEVAVMHLPDGTRKAWSPATAKNAWASILTEGHLGDRELAEIIARTVWTGCGLWSMG